MRSAEVLRRFEQGSVFGGTAQVRRAEMDSVAAVPSALVEKKSNAAGREKFMDVYQQLKKEILSDSELVTYTEESRAWVEEVTWLPNLSFGDLHL